MGVELGLGIGIGLGLDLEITIKRGKKQIYEGRTEVWLQFRVSLYLSQISRWGLEHCYYDHPNEYRTVDAPGTRLKGNEFEGMS